MKTLNDILEDWFIDDPDKPLALAEMELEELLNDIEEAGGFMHSAITPEDIMDNLRALEKAFSDRQ